MVDPLLTTLLQKDVGVLWRCIATDSCSTLIRVTHAKNSSAHRRQKTGRLGGLQQHTSEIPAEPPEESIMRGRHLRYENDDGTVRKSRRANSPYVAVQEKKKTQHAY